MLNSAVQLDTSEFLDELLRCSKGIQCPSISATDIFSKLEKANELTEVEMSNRFVSLDFAMPITFIAMIAPMLRTAAHLAACFVAVLAALLLAGLPSGLGLLIAAPLGMAARAQQNLGL